MLGLATLGLAKLARAALGRALTRDKLPSGASCKLGAYEMDLQFNELDSYVYDSDSPVSVFNDHSCNGSQLFHRGREQAAMQI